MHIFKNSNNNNMESATVYFEKQEDIINISSFSIYYYDNKLRWASTEGQEFKTIKNKSFKDYIEPEIYQKRSAKSLGKRREYEQEQEGEYSKSVQDRIWLMENSQQELEKVKTENIHKEKNNNYRKESRYNEGEKANKYSYYRNSDRSLEYIAHLVQNLEEKLVALGIKCPNRS